MIGCLPCTWVSHFLSNWIINKYGKCQIQQNQKRNRSSWPTDLSQSYARKMIGRWPIIGGDYFYFCPKLYDTTRAFPPWGQEGPFPGRFALREPYPGLPPAALCSRRWGAGGPQEQLWCLLQTRLHPLDPLHSLPSGSEPCSRACIGHFPGCAAGIYTLRPPKQPRGRSWAWKKYVRGAWTGSWWQKVYEGLPMSSLRKKWDRAQSQS